MRIETIRSLGIPEVKVVTFHRFGDHRGYFTETYRRSDVDDVADEIGRWPLAQVNESYSRKGTLRGLHFQWNPYMGKLVRTIVGHMIDIVLDIRKGSPTVGKVVTYDMPMLPESPVGEWIWVPPGFAHGNFFREDTTIEYFCSGEYSPNSEAGITPLAQDIDWSMSSIDLPAEWTGAGDEALLISDKDRNNQDLTGWLSRPESEQFRYAMLTGPYNE